MTEQTKPLDWTGLLLARHPDGREVDGITASRAGNYYEVTPLLDGFFMFNVDGIHHYTKWTIHNRPLDWNGLLVARHPDGREKDVIAHCRVGHGQTTFEYWEITPSLDGCYSFSEDGTHPRTEWTIHNRTPASAPDPDPEPAYAEGMTPALVAEMTQLCRVMANSYRAGPSITAQWQRDAIDILDKLPLPQPVDPLIQEAREACAAVAEDADVEAFYRSGDCEDSRPMLAVIYALRERDAKLDKEPRA